MTTDPAIRPAQRPGGSRVPLGRRMLKVGLAFVSSVLLLNLLAGSRGLPAVLQARREFQREEHSLTRLKSENAALRHEVRRLREDADAVEEVARRDLGYIAPGEKVFIIRDVAPPGAATPTPPIEPTPGASPAP